MENPSKKPAREPAKKAPDLSKEPPPPRTDDPARDKTELNDGVLEPIKSAD